MGKVLPSEIAARACVAKLVSQKEKQIQELLRDKHFFLIVDEAEVAKQCACGQLRCSKSDIPR